MYLQWLHVDYSQSKLTIDQVNSEVSSLLASFYQNGQCETNSFLFKQAKKRLSFQVITPEKNSLSKRYTDKYGKKNMAQLKERNITYKVELIGKDYDSMKICRCSNSSSYMLFNSELSIHIIRCVDCDGFLPLYKVPAIENDTTYNLVGWNKNYNACDDLQLNCTVLEYQCIDEMYRLHSSLNKEGLACRDTLAELLGKPVYYPLYRCYSSCYKQDVARKCPSCGGEWLLEEEWKRYHFCCNRCHLVSNLAYNYDF